MQLAHTLSWWGLNPNPMLQICLRIFPPKTDVLRMQPEGDIQMPELLYAAPFTTAKLKKPSNHQSSVSLFGFPRFICHFVQFIRTVKGWDVD